MKWHSILAAILFSTCAAAAGDGPQLYLAAGPTVNFMKLKQDGSSVSAGTVSMWLHDSDTSTTSVGGEVMAGVNLAGMDIPLILAASYQYFGKLDFSSTGYIRESSTGVSIPFSQKGDGNLHGVNLYARYDYGTDARIRPFVTGRVGMAYFNGDGRLDSLAGIPTGFVPSVEMSKWAFSYGIGAGVTFQVNECVSLDAAYEFTQTAKVKMDDYSGKVRASGHGIRAGIGICF